MEFRKEKKIVDQQVKSSGIDKMFDVKRMNLRSSILKDKNPNISFERIRHHVIKEEVRSILKKSLYWTIKWLTPPKEMDLRVEEIHYVACQFLAHGMKAIPDKYRYTPTNIFKDRRKLVKTLNNSGEEIILDATPQLIMMPRGLGKSTQFHVIGAIHEIIRDPYAKFLITHGNREKASDNLSQILGFITQPVLGLIFPEIFADDIQTYRVRGSKIRREKIDLKVVNAAADEAVEADVRREATLTTGSMGVNLTGQHFDMQLDDDLLTEENSKTEEQNRQAGNYYRATFALANRADRIYPRRLTATEQWGPNFYHELEKEITVFKVDGRQFDKNGGKFYLSRHWTDENVDIMRKNWKEWFAAYFHMIPRDSSESLKLVDDESFLFSFLGEQNHPERAEMIDHDLKYLLKNGCVVTSKDPSYSDKHKDSQDATATGIIHNGILYMIDESQIAGAKAGQDITSVIYPLLEKQVVKYNSDIFIQDAQGTQEVIAQEYFKKLKVKVPTLQYTPYKRPPVRNTKNKSERAQLLLSELFNFKKIRIHHSCIRMISEVMRTSHTFDFLDVLIQIVSLGNFDTLSEWGRNRKKHFTNKRKKSKILINNKTIGY